MNKGLLFIIRIILNIINGIAILRLVSAGHEGDKVGRLGLSKQYRVFILSSLVMNRMKINNAVIKPDQELVGIQLLSKVFFVEEADAISHNGIFEARCV